MNLYFTLKVILLPMCLHLLQLIFLLFVILQLCTVYRQILLLHHPFKFIVEDIVPSNHQVTHFKCQLFCLLQLRQLILTFQFPSVKVYVLLVIPLHIILFYVTIDYLPPFIYVFCLFLFCPFLNLSVKPSPFPIGGRPC